MDKKRLIIGMSGASGAPLTVTLLKELRKFDETVESHLILTKGAELTLQQETAYSVEQLKSLADVVYDCNNIGAGPASGSFCTMGMMIVPCSMKTIAGIHSGFSDNLLLRAADVTLKECRRLVLAARECPLSTIHLRNMYELSQMGAVILPPVLSYYNHPVTLEDAAKHIAGKLLDMFGLSVKGFRRWDGMESLGRMNERTAAKFDNQ